MYRSWSGEKTHGVCCYPCADVNLQAQRVNERKRGPSNVRVSVDPASQPNGVELRVPPNPRIVIPEVVVMRIARLVEILPGKAVVDAEGTKPRGVLVRGRVSERLAVVPAPYCNLRMRDEG